MSSDGASISSLRVSKSGNITGASCISNFASIYRTNLEDMATRHTEITSEREAVRGSTQGGGRVVSTVDNRPPFTLYGNPGGMMGSSPGPEGTTTTEGATRTRTPGSGDKRGDSHMIRADRLNYNGSRERVTDREEDWRAAEPKHKRLIIIIIININVDTKVDIAIRTQEVGCRVIKGR